MRVFKTKRFAKYCGKKRISDASLCEAVARAAQGSIDADLGGGVIKQRVARAGGGESGGFRAIIFYKAGTRAIFQDGFAKNEQDSIAADELFAFKKLAKIMLEMKRDEIGALLVNGSLTEVNCDEDY